ncbi:FG-GAP repeat domain-containing protein [Aquirufa sp. 5-AUSEE-100C1]
MKNCLFLLLGLISVQIQGQSLRFEVFQGMPVQQNASKLLNPWAGGMNSMQYQSMDLNGDSVLDVVCFDRTSQQISPFLQSVQGTFRYAPEYVTQFPMIENWFILVDYNQDGWKDLFCATGAGMKVYQQKIIQGKFNFELVKNPLYTTGFSGLVNLYVASPDIPVVADVDNDGDVDVLAFEPGGHYIEFHENVSVQKTGSAGLLFEKSVTTWGGILHNDCFDIQINANEFVLKSQSIQSVERVSHVGNALGRTANNDLYFGQVSCPNLSFLKNTGSGPNVKYSQVNTDYLSGLNLGAGVFWSAVPLRLSGPEEDVFVSVNTPDNAGFQQDFQRSSFWIINGKAIPFLQDQMIDVGEKASPCFVDVDRDGDLDLLIGHTGNRKGAGIVLYENQQGLLVFKTSDYFGLAKREVLNDVVLQTLGETILLTAQGISGPVSYMFDNQKISPYSIDLGAGEVPIVSPWGLLIHRRSGRIQLGANLDWGQLSQEKWQLRSAQIGDLDGDGEAEFVGFDTDGLLHVGNYEANANKISWRSVNFSMPSIGRNARLQLADVSGDGRLDFVVGTGGGGVQLFENKSTSAVWEAQVSQTLQVWPNPSSETIYVLSNQSGELQCFNGLGQELDRMNIQSGITYPLTNSAIHFIRFTDLQGKVSTRKIQHD